MSSQQLNKLVTLIFQGLRGLREQIHYNFKRDGGGGSFLQFITLEFVINQGQPTMNEVANFLSIKAASATSIIDSLVKVNYLERINDLQDRRLIRLSATKNGRAILAKQAKQVTAGISNFLAVLNAREQQQFISILNKILKV